MYICSTRNVSCALVIKLYIIRGLDGVQKGSRMMRVQKRSIRGPEGGPEGDPKRRPGGVLMGFRKAGHFVPTRKTQLLVLPVVVIVALKIYHTTTVIQIE